MTYQDIINIRYNISEEIPHEIREMLIAQEIERLYEEEYKKYPLKNRIIELAKYQR